VNNRWVWIPDAVNTTPRYSPALVAFMPLGDNQVGWVPLGPGDPYVARYYDESWQPHYLTRNDAIAANLVNLAVPNAVSVIPINYFDRPIDRGVLVRTNPQMFARVQPTLDPLLLTPLRNAVLHSAWGRGKIGLPPGIAKKLNDTPVVFSTTPLAPPFKKDLAKSLRVEAIPEKFKNQKLKIKDDRKGEISQQADAARQQRIDALASEASKGNREATGQLHEVQKQQKQEQRGPGKAEFKGPPATTGERVGHPAKPPKAMEAQQPQIKAKQPGPPKRSAAPQPVKPGKQKGPPAAKPGKPEGQGQGKGKKKP
jgi:hypothetical protein